MYAKRSRDPNEPVHAEVLPAPFEAREVARMNAEALRELLLRPAAVDAKLGDAASDSANDGGRFLRRHARRRRLRAAR